jgi:predicted phage replisome organizer
MADVKWIKLATEIFDNRKIRQIECLPDGDGIIVVWFKLLCLAGNINDNGMVYFTKDIPYTEQMLAMQFNRPLPLIQLAMATFQKFGMIEIVNDIFLVSNWEKYQSVDKLNELREYNRLAQRKSREKRKLLAVNDKSMTSQPCQGTDIEEDIDIDKDIEKESVKKKTASRFIPPTLEEVQAYCKERGNNVDPERFIDYYTANGWKQKGGNSIKDWKATIRTWEKRDNEKPAKKPKSDGSEYADLT